MLSKRAHNFDVDLDYIHTYSADRALRDPYDAKTNPSGIINFGTAVNGLMDNVWLQRFKEIEPYKVDKSHFRYYQFWGTRDFLQVLSTFMTKYFQPYNSEISVDNLLVFNGALLTLDLLVCLLGDKNDVFLCPSPAYGSYFQACAQRWDIEMVIVPMKVVEPEELLDIHFDSVIRLLDPVAVYCRKYISQPYGFVDYNVTLTNSRECSEENDLDVHFELTLDDVEKVFNEERAKGKNIRAFLLNNPHNPLGKVFDKGLVVEIMKFCQRNNLHLIVDEMYCLSVFDPETEYSSVLSIKTDDFIQPDLLHVIWGFSKDLCLVSYRTGVIHTRNESLKLNLKSMALYQAASVPTMTILKNIINDCDWFKEDFFPKNHILLRRAYLNAKSKFRSKGIRTTCSSAGFFFLADFRPFIVPLTNENCRELVKVFYDNKVYLTPYWEMRAPMGWYRVIFSVYSDEDFQTGYDRICASIDNFQLMSKETR